jgi:glycine hydroxymethyltransferase
LAEGLLEHGWRLVTGGTDTHIIMMDVGARGMTGAEAQERLERIGIVSNRNQIPFDTRDHTDTSGLRLGTAAVTARGLGREELGEIADLIDRALSGATLKGSEEEALTRHVQELCAAFPLYERSTDGPVQPAPAELVRSRD